MRFIDTHTHIYLPEFDDDRDEVVGRAINAGVTKMMMPNIDPDSVAPMLAAERQYPGICLPMIGLHPTSVKMDYSCQLDKIIDMVPDHKFYAVGEIGIDLYWDKTFLREQITVFKKQVEIAIDSGLPVIIHSRNSFPQVFDALDEYKGSGIKGIFHAFTGTVNDAEKAVTMGFSLGIGGVVTFKNSGLDKTLKEIGPDNIVLETDSPYLSPVPYRGKRNESSYICIVTRKLSEVFGITEEKVGEIAYNNSVRLFAL